MALFREKTEAGTHSFRERRTKGRLVTFHADIVAEHVPSPALALQQLLAEQAAADGFIADPVERRKALIRFVSLFVLLWGGSAAALAMLILVAG